MAAWPDPADYGIPNTWIPGPGRLVQYESMSSLSDIERTILFNEAVLHQQYKEIIEKLEKMRQDHTSQDHTSCLGFSAPIDATEIMSIDPTSMAIDSTSAGTSPDSTTPLASEPHRVVSTLAIREKHGPHDPQSQQPKSGSTGAQNDLFNHSKKRPAEEDLDAGPSAKLTKSSSTPKPILRPPPPPPPPTPENIFSIFYMEINLLKLKVPPSQLERLESIEGALRSLLKTMTREGKLKRGELRCIFALAQALQHHDFDGVNERKADVLWIFRWKYRPYYGNLIEELLEISEKTWLVQAVKPANCSTIGALSKQV